MQAVSIADANTDASTNTRAAKRAALYIIGERDAGFFSLVQQVIANVAFAVHEGRIPIVLFGKRSGYWTPNGYRGRDTVWEYYFEPVIPEYPVRTIPAHIRRYAEEKLPDGLSFGDFLDDGTFITANYGEHRAYRGKSLFIPFQFEDPSKELRRRASEIIHQYVRVRPEIIERVEKFYQQNMAGRPNIGVHVRGTDALVDESRARWGSLVDFDRYRSSIDGFLRSYPEAGIFVASDAESSIQKLRDIYGDRVIATEAIRYTGGPLAGRGPTGQMMTAYLTGDPDIAAKGGEEAVIDYLLLSRCNALVHNGSSLSRTVLLNVPEMPVSHTNAPSYFVRKTFYLVRALKRAWKIWLHRAAAIRATIAGQPLSSWPHLLRRQWLERQRKRREMLGSH
jgi:hypothetical protein